MEEEINNRIFCNVEDCIFNEHGKDCNLDKVSISKGKGEGHFCKSFISLDNQADDLSKINQRLPKDVESAKEYIDYGQLMKDVENDIDKITTIDNNEI